MADAPGLPEIAALAARALGHLGDRGQATALWERTLGPEGPADRLTVTCTAVLDGRAGATTTDRVDDAHLARAAKAAVLRARQARAWPAPPPAEPAEVPGHDGFDPAVLDAAAPPAPDGLTLDWRAGASRHAVASGTGVRAAEERSHVVARLRGAREGGRTAAVTVAGTGRLALDAAAAEVRALLGEGPSAGPFAPVVAPGREAETSDLSGEPVVVLGPGAVAAVLERLRAAFGVDLALGAGPLAGRLGRRVAAPAITVRDDAGHPGTLPRAADAEGLPRRAVVLVRDGIAAGAVHDTASAARAGTAGTGHATRPATLAPYPDHLVLAAGDAGGVDGLIEPVADGLFVPALERAGEAGRHRTVGAARIRAGQLAVALAPLEVEVASLALLEAIEALTAQRRLVPWRGHAPGGIGAAIVPGLRAGRGLRVVG